MKNKKKVALTLGIVCLILVYAIFLQINTIRNFNSMVAETSKDEDLRNQVLRWKEKYDKKYEEFEDSEKKLAKIRENSTRNSESESEIEKEIKRNNMLLGSTVVKGKGVEVTLKDNSEVTSNSVSALDNIEYYLVHAADITSIVNELKNAGAEAISINNQRVISTSSITCEGNVIKINGEKIGSPFVIQAIGSPELLYGLARPGGYIELLNDTGVIAEITKKESITIPKYTGVMNYKYCRIYE